MVFVADSLGTMSIDEEEVFHVPTSVPHVMPCTFPHQVSLIEPVSDDVDHIKEVSPEYQVQYDYLHDREDVTPRMRAILMDWLSSVCRKFGMELTCFFTAVNIIDRFVLRHTIESTSVQLVGITSLFIAAKIEEIYPPSLVRFANVTCHTYSENQVLNMEKVILEALDYRLNIPSPFRMLHSMIAQRPIDVENRVYAEYLLQVASIHSNMLRYRPSQVAQAAFTIAISQCEVEDTPVIRDLLKLIVEPPVPSCTFIATQYFSTKFYSVAGRMPPIPTAAEQDAQLLPPDLMIQT